MIVHSLDILLFKVEKIYRDKIRNNLKLAQLYNKKISNHKFEK